MKILMQAFMILVVLCASLARADQTSATAARTNCYDAQTATDTARDDANDQQSIDDLVNCGPDSDVSPDAIYTRLRTTSGFTETERAIIEQCYNDIYADYNIYVTDKDHDPDTVDPSATWTNAASYKTSAYMGKCYGDGFYAGGAWVSAESSYNSSVGNYDSAILLYNSIKTAKADSITKYYIMVSYLP